MHFVHTYIHVWPLWTCPSLWLHISHPSSLSSRIAGWKPHGNQLLGLLTLENTNTISHHAPFYWISISQGRVWKSACLQGLQSLGKYEKRLSGSTNLLMFLVLATSSHPPSVLLTRPCSAWNSLLPLWFPPWIYLAGSSSCLRGCHWVPFSPLRAP